MHEKLVMQDVPKLAENHTACKKTLWENYMGELI